MKKLLSVALCLVMLATIFSVATLPVSANQSCTSGFSKNYTLSGNPVSDMIAIANAQLNRTQSQFGYAEMWCDNFVSDCAILAGQAAAIPQGGVVSDFLNKLLNAGGKYVSSPAAGDIAIFKSGSTYSHAGLMTDSSYCISGNMTTYGYSQVEKYTYSSINSYNGWTCVFVRPAYKTSSTPTAHTHSYTSSITKAATCTATGVRTYKCSCGASYKETIPALGHTYSDMICTRCGEKDCEIPEKPPFLTVCSYTSTDDVVFVTADVKHATSYDYKIFNADTNERYCALWSCGIRAGVQLPAGRYYVNVQGVNSNRVDAGYDVWWGAAAVSEVFIITEGTCEAEKSIEYNGHKYELYLNQLTWGNAKKKCEELGGHLVTITSFEERAILSAFAEGCNYWLGATDEKSEGDWEWITGEEFSYSNWDDSEPSNEGDLENYLMAWSNGKWNDMYHATGENIGFICEYDEYSIPSTIEPTATGTGPSTTKTEPSSTVTNPTETSATATNPTVTDPTQTEPSTTKTEPSSTATNPTATSTETATGTETTATGTTALCGDANGDGAVNMKDVLTVRKFLAGMDVSINVTNSDTNNDTFVNMKDVLQLRKYLAGLIPTLGV